MVIVPRHSTPAAVHPPPRRKGMLAVRVFESGGVAMAAQEKRNTVQERQL